MQTKERKKMAHSISTKLTLITVMIIIFVVCLTWILNKSFIQQYYEKSKLKNLENVYQQIGNIMDTAGEELSDENVEELERLSTIKNVDIYIFTLTGYYSGRQRVGIDLIFPQNINSSKGIRIFDDISKYVESGNTSKENSFETLSENDDHNIYKVYNSRLRSYNLELIGVLDSGENIYISSNFESIKESADIASRFLAFVGLFALLVGAAIMSFVSRSFTKPILEAADIADKMAALDFETKYDVQSDDEIGRLGQSLNILSTELEKTIGELKTANNELTRDIEQKTQIDEMRKEFLSNVSHELKTPIALIQGYAEGLKENISDDTESRDFYCDVIMDEASKMNNMVRKLLDLNHIEFGDDKADFQRFDITDLIRGVINNSSILIEQKEARVEFDEPKLSVWADEFMIEEVVTNYVSNALNHIDGEKIIRISYERSGESVRIKVFNTGNTIPEDELDKIWIKFYKVDKARTREYGGSGVGLSIVKAIMDSHNKPYGAVNHEDGVEFWFELDVR